MPTAISKADAVALRLQVYHKFLSQDSGRLNQAAEGDADETQESPGRAPSPGDPMQLFMQVETHPAPAGGRSSGCGVEAAGLLHTTP